MRFGGHQTFPIRDGWLHKGLKNLKEAPERLTDEHAADWLGVGRNMAKSINHWLIATGLAEGRIRRKSHGGPQLEISDLGMLIWQNDRYFLEIGTLWALHVNLVNSPEHAASWTWFFNRFNMARFDRAVCVESLKRYLELEGGRMPSINTLKRDVACLLGSYSNVVPPMQQDPEEVRECPFVELGILSHFRGSGYYQLHQQLKRTPSELLGYAIARSIPDAAEGEGTVAIELAELVRVPGGPARAFALGADALYEFAERAEEELGSRTVRIEGLATQRAIRVLRQPSIEWLRIFYERTEESRHAA